jgi:hypothetical protein
MAAIRRVLSTAGGAAILWIVAGCGGSQLPTASIPLGGPSSQTAQARSGDLLYVSDSGGRVYFYSYPVGRLVGTLTGFRSPEGLCSDAAGDVYVIDTPAVTITKFAHGGRKPLSVLHVFGYFPQGCSVDPTSGDLAVADYAGNPSLGPGAVTIFRGAKGMGKSYQDPSINQYFFCSYDPKGNLYVDGTNAGTSQVELAEMPHGSTSFTNIALDKGVGKYPLGVQWDGKYVALQGSTRALYRIAVSGSNGHVVQTTIFKGDHSDLVAQFSIAGSTIVIPYGNARRKVRKVGLWPYPSGGAAMKSFGPPPRVAELFGTTLSLAPK